MEKSKIRFALDVVMTVLCICAMFVQITGNVLHEIIGVVFFICIVVHIGLSFNWIRGVAKQVENAKVKNAQLAMFVIAILLVVDLVVLAVSSVTISRVLAGFGIVPKIMSSMWMNVHTVSSYVLCVLVVVHLSVHWVTIARTFKIPYDPERRKVIGTGVKAVTGVGVVALAACCYSSLELDVASQPRSHFGEDGGSSSAQSGSSDSLSKSSSNSSSNPTPSSSGGKKYEAVSVDDDDDYKNKKDEERTICGLCHKCCPLSDPQCDKPFLAGLIA